MNRLNNLQKAKIDKHHRHYHHYHKNNIQPHAVYGRCTLDSKAEMVSILVNRESNTMQTAIIRKPEWLY